VNESEVGMKRGLFCLLLVMTFIAGMEAQRMSLQEFVVTIPVDTTKPIHVKATDRLDALMRALHSTVWTKEEWLNCKPCLESDLTTQPKK
jgi:hypothetical protein